MFTRLINCCWFVFRWGLALLVVAALAGGGYLYFRLDEEISRYAQTMLADHYQHLDVRVGGARFVPGRGITLFDIAFNERDDHGAAEPLLRIAELKLAGRFEVRQLLEGDSVVERVIVRRPELSVTRHADGSWSCQRLLPPPEGDGESPPLEIVDASLVVVDKTKPTAAPLVVRNADLTVERLPASEPGAAAPSVFRVEGAAGGSVAKRIAIAGQIDTATGAAELTASVDAMRLSHELLASTPHMPIEKLRGLQLQALASVQLTAATAGRGADWDVAASFRVQNGALDHAQLPRPLTDLNFAGSCNAEGLSIRNLTAKCGGAEITATASRDGWGPAAPIAFRGRIADLPLDDRLRAVLPPQAERYWRRFEPTGIVDIAATGSFDGARWRPDVTVDCRDLSVHDGMKFPYRVTGGRGVLRYFDSGAADRGTLTMEIQAMAEGRPVALSGRFGGLPCPRVEAALRRGDAVVPCPVGFLQVEGPRMSVSPALLTALEAHPKAAKIANSLSPSGEFGFLWRLEQKSLDQPKPDMTIDIDAIDCAINYDRFAYPLEHVRGPLRLRDGRWTFGNLECREPNGPRIVTASGSIATEAGRPTFRMRLSAVAAPLDDALRRALPPPVQEAWSLLRPQGRVSFTTDVLYAAGDPRPRIDVALEPFQRSVSIEPTFFQYRLEQVDGRFVWLDDRLQLIGARARHGRTQIASGGQWAPTTSGGWRFELSGLHVDYLDADHDLRLAAPLALRRVIDTLRPEGSFGVHDGRIAFTHTPGAPLQAEWDVQLDCHQTDLQVGVPIEGLTGEVRLAGTTGAETVSYGELRLDSAFWNGLQLTNVRGPFWANAQECRFGRGVADQLPTAPATEITANAYGGAVSMNTRVLFTDRPSYALGLGVRGVDLDRFTRDYLHSETPVAGRLDGQMTLEGQGSSIHNLGGGGALAVREANLYELPVMVALLKVLSNRTPDTTAFDGCDAEFTLQGEHLQFGRLDLVGDAVSLCGRGEASLDKDLNLIFHTIVGRNAPAAPLLRTLVGQASEQILRLRVQGTVDEPLIRREALPVVGNVLEQLRADLSRPLTQPAEVPRAAALRRQTRER